MQSLDNFKELLPSEFVNDLELYQNDKYIGININKVHVYNLIKFLKENEKFNFKQLIDITAIDYPAKEHRFNLVYILLSLSLNQRVVVKTFLKIDEIINSITNLYKSANWYERECYDLFGIKFNNHPDLRRIMTDYNFEGHPLRKDFPLTGHNEVRYDDLEKRVVYEKVNLAQEYRNFDYSSPWEGLPNELLGDEKAKKNEEK
tara:strand:- start:36 stop:644 length:609 start_codon:yes stop_codon:yes gene_type:complete